MIRYLSFRKINNLLKVYFGYFISIILRKPFIFGSPYSLAVEPTNRCNLSCLECPSGNNISTRMKGDMPLGLYKKIIDDIGDYLLYHMLYFQGEPFLNSDIFNMISYADKRKIWTSISSNGHYLNEINNTKIIKSGLKKIVISIDGATQETYKKYRVGGDFEKVIEGVRDLILKKAGMHSKYPVIVLQFLVLKTNEHQIKKIRTLSKSLGVDKLELKTAQIEDVKNDLLPGIQKFSRYKKVDGKLIIKNKLKNRCFRIWGTMLISWEGIIAPCCFDKGLQFNMGLAGENKLNVYWRGMEFENFRRNVLINRRDIKICCNCTEGLKLKS